MIVSYNIDWKKVEFRADKDGNIKPEWACPFCKKEVFGFDCICGAKIPALIVKKDYS